MFENLTKDQACAKEIALIKLFHTTETQFGFNRSEGGTIMPLKPIRRAIPEDELKHLYLDLGWTRKQIAMYYGYCEGSIAKKLGELGIIKLPKVEILYDTLYYQYITLDKSEAECALYFNCSRGVIQRYLNLYGIHRPSWRRKNKGSTNALL